MSGVTKHKQYGITHLMKNGFSVRYEIKAIRLTEISNCKFFYELSLYLLNNLGGN
jgi:hypothetical protein